MIINQSQIADILGVTEETIRQWQAEGLPYTAGRVGEANEYDSARVVDWLIQRALTRAGKNKAALELELLELEVRDKRAKDALRAGTLVPAQGVESVWLRRVLAAAAFLSNAHSRLASELDAAPGTERKREILRSAFNQFLTHMGVNGELIHRETERLLASLSAEQAADFMRRIGTDVAPSPPAGPATAEILR